VRDNKAPCRKATGPFRVRCKVRCARGVRRTFLSAPGAAYQAPISDDLSENCACAVLVEPIRQRRALAQAPGRLSLRGPRCSRPPDCDGCAPHRDRRGGLGPDTSAHTEAQGVRCRPTPFRIGFLEHFAAFLPAQVAAFQATADQATADDDLEVRVHPLPHLIDGPAMNRQTLRDRRLVAHRLDDLGYLRRRKRGRRPPL
jgi:hypothetical protein